MSERRGRWKEVVSNKQERRGRGGDDVVRKGKGVSEKQGGGRGGDKDKKGKGVSEKQGGGRGGDKDKNGKGGKGGGGGGNSNEVKNKAEEKTRPFDYGRIPDSYKIEFVINRRNKFTDREYRKMITSIRLLCNIEGTKFDEIPNLNVDREEKALIEVKIIHGERWAKFLISRYDLYLVGIMVPACNVMYADSIFEIDGFERVGITSKYSSDTPLAIGPDVMIQALQALNGRSVKPDFVSVRARCFFIPLCEASRYHVIENFVAGTLNITGNEFPPDDEDIETLQFETGFQGEEVNDNNYVGQYMVQSFQINEQCSSQLPAFFAELIKCYDLISKAWFKYSLSDKRYRVLSPYTQQRCHIRNVSDISSILAILSNVHIGKLKDELKGISEKNPPNENYTGEDHANVLAKITDLKQRRKAFLNLLEEGEEVKEK